MRAILALCLLPMLLAPKATNAAWIIAGARADGSVAAAIQEQLDRADRNLMASTLMAAINEDRTDAFTMEGFSVERWGTAAGIDADGSTNITWSPGQVTWSFPPQLSTNGQIAHWTFDDAEYTSAVIDATGNYPATAQQDTAVLNAPGHIADCLYFNGSTDYITAGPLQTLNDYTICLWYRAETVGGTQQLAIACDRTPNGANVPINLYIENAQIRWGVTEQYHYRILGYAYPQDTDWHLICATRSGTSIGCYIDGEPGNQQWGVDNGFSAAGPIPCAKPVYFGAQLYQGISRQANGWMDDVRIFSRLLTAGEILALYNGIDPTLENARLQTTPLPLTNAPASMQLITLMTADPAGVECSLVTGAKTNTLSLADTGSCLATNGARVYAASWRNPAAWSTNSFLVMNSVNYSCATNYGIAIQWRY